MKNIFKILILLSTLMLTTSCAINPINDNNNSDVVELSLAELHMEGYPSTEACVYFADTVRKRTDGRINITVYSNGKLGTENEAIKGVMSGNIDIARVNANPLSSYCENLTPIVLPFVINNQNHLMAVINSELGDNMLNSLGNNLVGLNWYYSGSRCFYSTEPIYTPADLQGKNVRIQSSAIMEDMITYLGGNPIVMDWSEMYDAFEKGTLFAGENDIPSYMNFAHGVIAPYYTYDNHVYSPSVVIMNEDNFNELSEEDRNIIMEAAKESQNYELALWSNYENAVKQSLEKEGSEFITLTAEQKQLFIDACQPLYEKYATNYIDEIEKIKKLGN